MWCQVYEVQYQICRPIFEIFPMIFNRRTLGRTRSPSAPQDGDIERDMHHVQDDVFTIADWLTMIFAIAVHPYLDIA